MVDQARGSFDLDRFVTAQAGGVFEAALGELGRGRKEGHWIWFVFPQVDGLGQSSMSRRYAIGSLAEARAYLAHPVLGPRLRASAQALLDLPPGPSAAEILGGIDAVKLRSSMTLFWRADPGEAVFRAILDRYFGAVLDPATDRILGLAAP